MESVNELFLLQGPVWDLVRLGHRHDVLIHLVKAQVRVKQVLRLGEQRGSYLRGYHALGDVDRRGPRIVDVPDFLKDFLSC